MFVWYILLFTMAYINIKANMHTILWLNRQCLSYTNIKCMPCNRIT